MIKTTKPRDPGAIVVVDFPGVTGIKRRPAVVVSSPLYHRERPDVIFGIITSQIASATAASDYVLQDWKAAGYIGNPPFALSWLRCRALRSLLDSVSCRTRTGRPCVNDSKVR
jgi:mRNA-degrading endonuclease toxin of MazEF toxin-antitoxin module